VTPLASVSLPTSLAICYLILGAGFAGMIVILLQAIWAGSLARIWADIPYFMPSIRDIALAMTVNFSLAGLLFKFERRRVTTRGLAVILAISLVVAAFVGAIQVLRLWQSGTFPLGAPVEAVWLRPIGALIYGWLAFQVLKLARASNKPVERGV
jgi:hypothetical protein